MKKFLLCPIIAALLFVFAGCYEEEPAKENIAGEEQIYSENEEEQKIPKEPELPAEEELFAMAEDALYFHCHTMDGADFYEYGGFEKPEDISAQGLYNFFIAKNGGEKYLGKDKAGYHIPKKYMIDFYSGYFCDVSFLEEKLDGIYSASFFSAYKEENVIFHENPEIKAEGEKITLKTDDYEAVFCFSEGKVFYESFSLNSGPKWGLETELFVTDPESETYTDEEMVISGYAYSDWRYVKTNTGRYISSRKEPFNYYESLNFYREKDLYEPFGSLTVYKDTGTTFDELLAKSSVLVFEEDIIPVENIFHSAEKACYVKLTYPSKNGEPGGYLRTYIIQYDGYVAFSNIYIEYSEQERQEGECEEFISGLNIVPKNL